MAGNERAATAAVAAALADAGLEHEQPSAGHFVVVLPGERKQRTTCSLVVGAHSLSVNAFVVRRPEENVEQVYRWLLRQNARGYLVAFALDGHGDVYLIGRVPLHAVTVEEVDRILGAVLDVADSSFNSILELGFGSAIRREWQWRTSRGESTANLAAFAHRLERPSGEMPPAGDTPAGDTPA